MPKPHSAEGMCSHMRMCAYTSKKENKWEDKHTKSSIMDVEVTGNLYLFFDLCISLYLPNEHELFI